MRGLPLDELRDLAEHWRTGYDWRAQDRCAFEPGSDDPAAMLDADFEVVDAPPLADALRALAARLERAAGPLRP